MQPHFQTHCSADKHATPSFKRHMNARLGRNFGQCGKTAQGEGSLVDRYLS
jgi:hypothetical protein